MGRFVILAALAACGAALLALAPSAGSGGGDVGPSPDGLLVLGVVGRGDSTSAVKGERAMVADPRTGETRSRRLPGGTLCHGPLMAIGDSVLYPGYRGRRAVALSLPPSLSGAPRSLGAADTMTPSATPGRVWLGRWAKPGEEWTHTALRELDLAGEAAGGTTGPPVVARTSGRLPRWGSVHAALAGGFLVASGRRLTLWEGGFDRPLRAIRDAWVVATWRRGFAWCGPRCRALRVRNPGGERTFRPPRGLRLLGLNGSFSPAGDRIAVATAGGGRTRVAVIDLASGEWSVVPGGRLGGHQAIAWSPSGRWLYFTGPGRRLLGWEASSQSAVRLPVEPDGAVTSIATLG